MTAEVVISRPGEFYKLLGHEIRWQILKALSSTDLHVRELVEKVDQPQNLVSYHLDRLRDQDLVGGHRSIADSREIYYSLNLDRIRELYFATGEALHPALSNEHSSRDQLNEPEKEVRVLFLCTHNSARSQIAEGILRARSNGKVQVYSAGTEATRIHPLAIRALSEMNIDISQQYSKNLAQFIGQHFDYIITVCDRAKESCPVFPGDPVRAHWSFPDPAAVDGPDEERYKAFKEASVQMMTRISYLLLVIGREYGLNLD